MPIIKYRGQEIKCRVGDNLRKVLLDANLSPHNQTASWLNCNGFGTCGTCAVEVKGQTSPLTKVEQWRLNFPPHHLKNNLRLACQCKVKGDLELKKYNGFWGQNVIK